METGPQVRLLQDLLQRPQVAVLVNLNLEQTSWTASSIARFLSTRPAGTPRLPGAPPTFSSLPLYLSVLFLLHTHTHVMRGRALWIQPHPRPTTPGGT